MRRSRLRLRLRERLLLGQRALEDAVADVWCVEVDRLDEGLLDARLRLGERVQLPGDLVAQAGVFAGEVVGGPGALLDRDVRRLLGGRGSGGFVLLLGGLVEEGLLLLLRPDL